MNTHLSEGKAQEKILIIGSTNTDMVVKTTNLPRPGETVIGGSFLMNPGGKGANQAVAAARLGADIIFVCKIGDDIFGCESVKNFEKEGIDTSYVFKDTLHASGVALITVDEKAENCIAVASGANACLLPSDIDKASAAFEEASVVLMQLEIPMETVECVAEKAFALGKKVILNPAPAQPLSDKLLSCLYMIIPNETEAEMLTGIKVTDLASMNAVEQCFARKGVKNTVITLGSKGSYAGSSIQSVADQMIKPEGVIVPANKVKAVDTTAAGDVYCGALAVALSEGKSLPEALSFATAASSISVTRMGAQASAPSREEVDVILRK